MIMALEITWENQPTLFLGHGADDRCHIGGRRNVLCKVKTKGNNKDINREEIIRYKNISNFSRWWQARQRWRKRRRVFLLLLRESAIGLSSLAGITRFFCLYDQIQIKITNTNWQTFGRFWCQMHCREPPNICHIFKRYFSFLYLEHSWYARS